MLEDKVLSIEEIKKIIIPVLSRYNIHDVFLFGSYSRGEARPDSDIDIYCEKGSIRTYFDQGRLEDELETALNKKVDIIFIGSEMNDYFKEQLFKDLIKL